MRSKSKKVFFDVDGTLLFDYEENVREEIIESINKLKKANYEIYLATGRSYGQAKHILKQLQITDGVFANGQTVIKNNKIIFNHTIKSEISQQVFQIAKKNKLKTAIFKYEGMFFSRSLSSLIVKYKLRNYPFGGIGFDKLTNSNNQGFWLFAKDLRGAKAEFDHDYFNVSAYGKTTLELTPKLFNKAEGIKKLIDQEKCLSIAFGDGSNDFEMFEYVDFAIAMDNANTDLKKKADYITKSNNENGIIHGIDYLLKNKN